MQFSILTPIVTILLSAAPAYCWDEYCNKAKTVSVGCEDSSKLVEDRTGRTIDALRCEFKGGGKIAHTLIQTIDGGHFHVGIDIDDTKALFKMEPSSDGKVAWFKVGNRNSGCDKNVYVAYKFSLEKGTWKLFSVSKTAPPL